MQWCFIKTKYDLECVKAASDYMVFYDFFFYIDFGLRQSEGTYEREDRLKLWTHYQKEYLEHPWSSKYMR